MVLLRTFAGGKSEFGARPRASSSAVMPKDQMSAVGEIVSVVYAVLDLSIISVPFESYALRSTTSGAIQHGVPTNDLRETRPLLRSRFSWLAIAAAGSWNSDEETPKSASNTVPSSVIAHCQGTSIREGRAELTIDQQVRGFNVPVEPAILMQVHETLERLLERSSDYDFVKAVWEGVFGDVEERARRHVATGDEEFATCEQSGGPSAPARLRALCAQPTLNPFTTNT